MDVDASLSAAPGVQVAQSGLYDFNINARGFNDLVNRNVRTEIDGRQPDRAWGTFSSTARTNARCAPRVLPASSCGALPNGAPLAATTRSRPATSTC